MGRRKERRLAAISAAGRRVKLDLFAEPSGDLDGSSAQNEVGGDGASNSDAELLTSLTSSGHKPQNPLLLLEQYSDEDLDEGSNDEHDNTPERGTSVDVDDKETPAAGKEVEATESNAGHEPSLEKVEELLMDIGSASEDHLEKLDVTNDSQNLHGEATKTEAATEPVPHDNELTGDVSSGWKMVLHEESNQYYYWNITTGETSWEVPAILAQGAVVTSVKEVDDTEERKDEVNVTNRSASPLGTEEGIATANPTGDSTGNCINSGVASQGTKVAGSNEGFEDDFFSDANNNREVSQQNKTPLLADVPVVNGTKTEDGSHLPVELEKHCESMLERLSSVKGVDCSMDGQDLKSRFMIEIEIRLADIKALAPHGPSLLPFWLYTQDRLKQLDLAIDGVIQLRDPACLSEFEAILGSRGGSDDDVENLVEEKALSAAVQSKTIDNVEEKSNLEGDDNGPNTVKQLPQMLCPSTEYASNAGDKSKITETNTESRPNSRSSFQSGEDEDMDVDMEVEDTSNIPSVMDYQASAELPILQNTLVNQEALVTGQVFSAPPPGENWVPPPPPDNEPFPPPPPDSELFPPPPPDEPFHPPLPDEPPGTSSSYSDPVQSFPYSAQYTLPYPASSLEYYGQTHPEVSGTSFYTSAGGGQVAISQLPHYYEAVPNMYGVTPLVVNAVEPTAYYGLQNGNINPISLVNGGTAESCGTQSKPFTKKEVSYTAGALATPAEGEPSLSQKTTSNVSNADSGDGKCSLGVAGVQLTTSAPATSVTAIVSAPSTSDATSTSSAAAATSKAQSKVSRSKKRTVAVVSSLKSNKKVSSLVDKWKAAKEELHEEDEEPENAYEILEKKRWREIEEWRAQQIASGEARENVNFQPLGGDWRERVKRKRAEKLKEAGKSLSDVTTDGNKQPDLVELSRDLPSGWQAYWDDSSKQVYYGNLATSQTTWTRPTD